MPETSASIGHWLPWADCNLYRNPFGQLTRDERAEVAVVDMDSIMQRVGNMRSALQLIGDCGRGKTTRLLALRKRFPASSYVYLPEEGPCAAIAEGNPVLIDEAQRLPAEARRRIFATGLPLVLATHRDMSRQLRRFRYDVHTEWIGDGNTPELICQLLNQRIEASRLHAGAVPILTLDESRQLVQRFGSDIRGIEHYLYQRVQTQVAHHGEMRFID